MYAFRTVFIFRKINFKILFISKYTNSEPFNFQICSFITIYLIKVLT